MPLKDKSVIGIRDRTDHSYLRPLELTPESNGYRLRFSFNVTQADASDATNEYQVSLLQGDTSIAERSVKVKGRGKVDVALDPLQIFYPGGYVLVLEEVGAPRLAVSGVSLQVDTSVEKPKMWIAWSGLALLVLGVGVLLYDAIKIKQARSRR